MVNDPAFKKDVDRRGYRLGVTQVLTKKLVMNFDFDGITDEGFLNNPYRQVRFLDASKPDGYDWQAEKYPNTRTSSAFSLGGRYFVRPGSAVYGSARIFNDTWGVEAWDAQLGYTYSTMRSWLFDLSYRYYTQTGADFYSDLFDYADQQNFRGRDKELSTFTDHSIRLGVRYELPVADWGFVARGTANFNYDYIVWKYDDFHNVLEGGVAGSEPLYDMTADVIQLYVSFWF
jgi:opacity protein-like surface antigen